LSWRFHTGTASTYRGNQLGTPELTREAGEVCPASFLAGQTPEVVELKGEANHLKTGGDIADQQILLDDELGDIEAVAQRKHRVGVRHGTLLGHAKKGGRPPPRPAPRPPRVTY